MIRTGVHGSVVLPTQTGKWYLHSVVGDYLLSIFVPCDERAGEGSQSGHVDDGCSALRHRLPLLFSGKVPLDLEGKRERQSKRQHRKLQKECTMFRFFFFLLQHFY